MGKHDLSGIEKSIKSSIKELNDLGNGEDLEELLKIIRHPGWTTPAEFVLTTVLAENLVRQLEVARRMKAGLLAGANRVEVPR
jgi:hypothetical protein